MQTTQALKGDLEGRVKNVSGEAAATLVCKVLEV